MPQTAYVGKKHGLVFPAMCSGYIKIPYDTQTRGFWEHNDSFTIESVITPYDVNGYGIERKLDALNTDYTSSVSSKKIMPSLDRYTKEDGSKGNKFQDFNYITYADRFTGGSTTHKMYLFYNPKVELYLENTTATNENQPAEYKINFKVVTSGSTKTITSDAVILSRTEAYNVLQESDGTLIQTVYNKDMDSPLYVRASNTASDTDNYMTYSSKLGSVMTVTLNGGLKTEEFVGINQKLYTSDGTLIGTTKSTTVDAFPASDEIDFTETISFTPSGQIYVEAPKQAIYTESTYHIAAAFEASTGDMNIYVNGFNVKSDTHANPNPFYWGTEDSYIGQNASLSETIDKETAVVWIDTDALTSTIHGEAITSVTNQGLGGDFAPSRPVDAPFLLHDESINNYPILSFGAAGLVRGTYTILTTNWDMIVALKNSEAAITTLVAGLSTGDHIQIKKNSDVYYLEIEDNTTSVTSSTTSSILHDASYGAQVLRFKKTGDVLYIYNNGKYLQTVDVSAIGTLTLDFIGTLESYPGTVTDATANAKLLTLIIEDDNFIDEYANKVQGLLCDKYVTPSTHNPFENTYRKTARNTQFMGQLHDFAITKTARKFFDSMYTLVPQQKNTLLYYRFEETKDD